MSEIREGDLDRQDGHDTQGDENCAAGLCEHERGTALPPRRPVSPDFIIGAFFDASSRLHAQLTDRDDPEGATS